MATLRDERISATFLVPTMLRRLLDQPVPALPELRAILSGAAELPHELRVRAVRAFGAGRVFDFYGATELGWVTLCDGHEMLARPGTVGRALAGQEIVILGPDGAPLPVGETGLVCVRNEQGMDGYLRDAAATAASHRDGCITVDDLGRLDADGYLYLSGRARDMVKSGGVNLYPVEIEDALLGHPSIREVAVVGVPDPEWGETLVAVVVPQGAFDPSEVEAFLRGRLSGPKVPRRWELVTELPRNALGKVLKAELRSRYSTKL
jgi:acyl-CoA synthetase (AMP-forming)/AMP-acid ligase II